MSPALQWTSWVHAQSGGWQKMLARYTELFKLLLASLCETPLAKNGRTLQRTGESGHGGGQSTIHPGVHWPLSWFSHQLPEWRKVFNPGINEYSIFKYPCKADIDLRSWVVILYLWQPRTYHLSCRISLGCSDIHSFVLISPLPHSRPQHWIQLYIRSGKAKGQLCLWGRGSEQKGLCHSCPGCHHWLIL